MNNFNGLDMQVRELQDRIKVLQTENERLQKLVNTKWSGVDQLVQLRDDVDSIILGLNPADFHGAINWGDLGCARVERVVDEDNNTYIHIVIEEASPGETQLIMAVKEGLIRKGHKINGWEIETSW